MRLKQSSWTHGDRKKERQFQSDVDTVSLYNEGSILYQFGRKWLDVKCIQHKEIRYKHNHIVMLYFPCQTSEINHATLLQVAQSQPGNW